MGEENCRRTGRKCFASCLLVLSAMSAFAKRPHPAIGAFAFDTDPTHAVLVVTNGTAWTREGDLWRPGAFNANSESRGVYTRLGEEGNEKRRQEIGVVRSEWEIQAMSKIGVNVQTGDVTLVTIDDSAPSGRRWSDGHRLVRCPMPDLAAGRREKEYIGYWKPIKAFDQRGRVKAEGPELTEKFTLLITERGDAIMYFHNVTVTRDRPEPFRCEQVIPIDAGVRYDYRERYKDSRDPLNCLYRALWLDGDGILHVFSHDEHTIFERTEKRFENPVEARRKMAAEGAYHGVWGVNYEFHITIFSFDRSGKGMLSFFMGALLFDWKVVDGDIVCTPNPDIAALTGCDWKRFVMRYVPERNEMTVVSIDTKAGAKGLVGKSYKLLSWESNAAEAHRRFEEAMKDPRQRMEMEREKARQERRRKQKGS